MLLLFTLNFSFAADFGKQEDSYFVPLRTRIYWDIGFSLNKGTSSGYKDNISGELYGVELMRLVGKIKPYKYFIKNFWISSGLNYNYYQTLHLLH